MEIFLVGGAVRDELLGLPVRERDWVVVGGSENEMLAQGFRRADAYFPVFLHPQTGEEYALARRETKRAPGYRGFEIDSGPNVSLREDLERRDLTINAMARGAAGQLIDPFGGRDDLDAGLLRHVTAAFVEDPVRLLRIARFAARFGRWGFRVSDATFGLLKVMAGADELQSVNRQRLWQEMRAALSAEQPWRFFETLQGCGALAVLLPEFALLLGGAVGHGAQPSAPLQVLRRVSASSQRAEVRWAAFCLAALAAPQEALTLSRSLPMERAFSRLLVRVGNAYPAFRALDADASASAVIEFLETVRAFSRQQEFADLLPALAAQEGVDPQLVATISRAWQAGAQVTARDVRAAGFAGEALGRELSRRRRQAVAAALAD